MKTLNWSENSSEARLSVSDGVITHYLTEGAIPGEEFSLRELAEAYASSYDHNDNDDTFVVAQIEDLTDGETETFAFDGHGNFEWGTARQMLHY